jgi:hypothetical protein
VPPPLPLANTDAGPSHEPAASSVDAGASSSLRNEDDVELDDSGRLLLFSGA